MRAVKKRPDAPAQRLLVTFGGVLVRAQKDWFSDHGSSDWFDVTWSWAASDSKGSILLKKSLHFDK
jgi:hypothetical protein